MNESTNICDFFSDSSKYSKNMTVTSMVISNWNDPSNCRRFWISHDFYYQRSKPNQPIRRLKRNKGNWSNWKVFWKCKIFEFFFLKKSLNFSTQSTLLSIHSRYGHFSGINRKVQMKYQPKGRPRGSSSDDGNGNSTCTFGYII